MQSTPLSWINIINLIASICRDIDLATEDELTAVCKLIDRIEKREVSPEDFYRALGTFLQGTDSSRMLIELNKYLQYHRFDAPLIYALSAQNLAQAINDVMKNQDIVFGDGTKFSCVVKGKFAVVTITNDASYFSQWQYIFDVILTVFLFISRSIAGKVFDAKHLRLPTSRANSDESVLRAVTSANIEYSGNSHQIVFDKAWLTTKSFNHSLNERNRLETELDQRKAIVKTGIPFSEKVMTVVKQAESPTSVTLAQVSKQLGISESHARKKLADENTSFKYLCKWWLLEEAITKLMKSDTKIDVIALELGYSERAPFERAFKANLGISPSQFRDVSAQFGYADRTNMFRSRVEELPPLPESCRKLLQLPEQNMTLEDVVTIVAADPVFSGRLLGLASRAVFGAKPKTLKEAIGRNLGLEKVRQLALVFSAKDHLEGIVDNLDIEALVKSTVVSQMIYSKCQKQVSFDTSQPTDDYVLSMGLLGMFLLFHRDVALSKELSNIYKNSENFTEFMIQAHATLNVSVYKVSGIMLAVWGVNEDVVKELSIQGDILKGKSNPDSRYLLRVLSNSIAFSCARNTTASTIESDVFEPISESLEISQLTEFASKAAESIGDLH